MRNLLLTRLAVIVIALTATLALAAEKRMVRVAIYDDTQARRIPKKAELWLRNTGSVWLHQKCDRLSNGSLSCDPLDLGMRDVGLPLELYIYPNGRMLDGAGRETDELKVVFQLTADMCPTGCTRDEMTVAISDSEIKVSGAPILAAGTKKAILVVRRK